MPDIHSPRQNHLLDALPAAERDRLSDALLAAGTKPDLCSALETLLGFVPVEAPDEPTVKKK